MRASLEAAVSFALQQADPPCESQARGIARITYLSWRVAKGLEMRPVTEIEEAEARTIFLELWWLQCGCDDLPAKLDAVVFDAATQHGLLAARKWLAATNPDASPIERAEHFLTQREACYFHLGQRPRNLNRTVKWARRIAALRAGLAR